jgi:hypothetical protein
MMLPTYVAGIYCRDNTIYVRRITYIYIYIYKLMLFMYFGDTDRHILSGEGRVHISKICKIHILMIIYIRL